MGRRVRSGLEVGFVFVAFEEELGGRPLFLFQGSSDAP